VVIGRELDLDVGVGGTDGRGGGVGEIQSGVGQADVIDDGNHFLGRNLLADGGVDVVAKEGCFLNAGTGTGADVNFELAGIDGGKEVLPERRKEEADRGQGEDGEENEENGGMVDADGEQADVAVTHFLKAVFEAELKPDEWVAADLFLCLLRVVVLLQQVLGHGGHDSTREQVAGQHGENDRFCERHEEVAGHAAEQEHGHEDNADGEGGNKGRGGDLGCAVENGLLDFLAGFEIAIDVLDLHRCIVNQDADGERQASEGHDVDGLFEDIEHDERAENGERNGDRDDDGGAEAAEEDQDHDGGEAGGDERLTDYAVDGRAHKD